MKKMMTNESISMDSIIAMDMINKKDMFVNSQGERVRIINGWYKSEIIVGGYPVDGYCEGNMS